MESNELLTLLDHRWVKVTRTIVVEGPADKVYSQLNTKAAFLREDAKILGHIHMLEQPRVVAALNGEGQMLPVSLYGVCRQLAMELDRFADEGNPNHD